MNVSAIRLGSSDLAIPTSAQKGLWRQRALREGRQMLGGEDHFVHRATQAWRQRATRDRRLAAHAADRTDVATSRSEGVEQAMSSPATRDRVRV